MTIKQLFIQFLKDNNSYNKFVNNVINYKKVLYFENYFNYITINGSINLIGEAFHWESTKEGYWFWRKLSEKWKKILFEFLFPYLITILKKHNLYGYVIINKYKEVKKLKELMEIGLPSNYPYKLFKDTEKLYTTGYWKIHEKWQTSVLRKII